MKNLLLRLLPANYENAFKNYCKFSLTTYSVFDMLLK